MSDEMDEIWALYADDGAQALDAMEQALLELEGDVDGEALQGHVSALFRAVHTFKGNSRVLGLAVVESRAHLAEDLIGLVRDQGVPLDDEIRDVLLLAADTLRDMLEQTAATREDVAPGGSEELMERLRDKIARCGGGAGEADAGGAEAPAPTAEPEAAEELQAAEAPVEEPAPAEVAPAPEAAEPSPADAPEPSPAQAPDAAAAPRPASRLADDPTYMAIFRDMTADAVAQLRQAREAGDGAAAVRAASGLAHAARQMGLDDWVEALSTLPEAPSADDVGALLDAIEALQAGAAAPAPTPGAAPEEEPARSEADLLAAMQAPLEAMARAGMDFAAEGRLDREGLAEPCGRIAALADSHGLVRVSEAVRALLSAGDPAAFRRGELALYEALAAFEALIPASAGPVSPSPREMLVGWCADNVFDTLSELDATLQLLKDAEHAEAAHRDLARLMRLIHLACSHYRLETAADLSMSLLDLFARTHDRGGAPDPILMRIAHGYVDTLELVFDALHEGETPDTRTLETLFAETADACFTSTGLMTATAAERRLGLPPEFHRALSPESVRTASEALEAGMSFHILRADINEDEALAEAFLSFISSPAVRSVTNITVFEGERVLFDFLIATSFDDAGLVERLAAIDPPGRQVRLIRSLAPDAAAADAQGDPDDAAEPVSSTVGMSGELLESIGEIAAGQAMVRGMLDDLLETDPSETLDAILRQSGGDPARARPALRTMLEDLTVRLRALAQLEGQLGSQLTQLQEETTALRSRPAETVLRPLSALVETLSRRNGGEARLSASGEELKLDVALLDTLRRVLRTLVLARLELGEAAPRRLHVALHRSDDSVQVVYQDDGPQAEEGALDALRADLVQTGGSMREVRQPGGGMRCHITLPMSMVVLDGMIVGIDQVRYVLPVNAIRSIMQPPQGALFSVSAGSGLRMLRITEDEIIPVRAIRRTPGASRQERPLCVVLRRGERSVALPVDELIGQQLVLVRPLRGVLASLENVTGSALLAGGEVGMVLSVSTLCGDGEGRPAAGPASIPPVAAE